MEVHSNGTPPVFTAGRIFVASQSEAQRKDVSYKHINIRFLIYEIIGKTEL